MLTMVDIYWDKNDNATVYFVRDDDVTRSYKIDGTKAFDMLNRMQKLGFVYEYGSLDHTAMVGGSTPMRKRLWSALDALYPAPTSDMNGRTIYMEDVVVSLHIDGVHITMNWQVARLSPDFLGDKEYTWLPDKHMLVERILEKLGG